MEEAYELENYLPLSFGNPTEQEYVQFLWDAFATNYGDGKYQFAFLAYHMLTMSQVYFNIWQIKQVAPKDFEKAMIGFSKDTEKDLLNAKTPFAFWTVNESTVLRFLKLIGCDNGKIGTYTALVKERNNTAHSNGNVWFREKSALDVKITEILRVVTEIQTHSKPIVEQCYAAFLLSSQDAEEREYPNPGDQVREILIHENYFSQRDMDICRGFDPSRMAGEPGFTEILALHQTVQESYAPIDE